MSPAPSVSTTDIAATKLVRRARVDLVIALLAPWDGPPLSGVAIIPLYMAGKAQIEIADAMFFRCL